MIRVVTESPEEFTAANLRAIRQIPFAAAQAVNLLAQDFQAAQRSHMRSAFTIRRAQFVERSIKISHWARKSEPWAEVAVIPPGGRPGGIFSEHEDVGFRLPREGGRARAVPVDAKRSKTAVITKANRPAAFRFSEARSSGVQIYHGERRTFMVRQPDGSGRIMQRVGPGPRGDWKTGLKVLYTLHRQTKIPGELKFRETAERTAPRYTRLYTIALTRALATARWGSGIRSDAELLPAGAER